MAMPVDSNLPMEILPRGRMSDMYDALAVWIADTLKGADQIPVGKTITLLVTTDILRGYRTGFGRNNYSIDSPTRARFKKRISIRKLVGRSTYFTIRKIGPASGGERRWRGGKYDKAHFEAFESAVGLGRLEDRHIVSASADRSTRGRMAGEFTPSKCGERIHIVDCKGALDGLIMG